MFQKHTLIFIVTDLSITQAFPCRCRLADSQRATTVESEVSISNLLFSALQ